MVVVSDETEGEAPFLALVVAPVDVIRAFLSWWWEHREREFATNALVLLSYSPLLRNLIVDLPLLWCDVNTPEIVHAGILNHLRRG